VRPRLQPVDDFLFERESLRRGLAERLGCRCLVVNFLCKTVEFVAQRLERPIDGSPYRLWTVASAAASDATRT